MRKTPALFLVSALLLYLPAAGVASADSGAALPPTESAPPLHKPGLAPPASPSQTDPGILKQPEHLPPPAPEAVVPPPVVDPKMAIDPEKSPRPSSPPPPSSGNSPNRTR